MDTYFYHQIIRKTVIGFGTLFNNIKVQHKDSNNNAVSTIKVPLSYAPTQKFLAKAQQESLNKKVEIDVPRMSFEMTGITYDPSRKSSITQTFKAFTTGDGRSVRKVYMPVPYNLSIQLNIYSKLNDDSLQVLEQILPFFQPSLNVTIDLVSSIGETKDVPIVLEGISQREDYEGDYNSRRTLIHTLSFTAKTHLFGPVADSAEGLIKKVTVDSYSSTDVKTAQRSYRYTVTPRAVIDYNNDATTVLNGAVDSQIGKIIVSSSTNLSEDDVIRIDSENMLIKTIDGNSVYVTRGYDNTSSVSHEHASIVNVINALDDALIEPDDDFGFNEDLSFVNDGYYLPEQSTGQI